MCLCLLSVDCITTKNGISSRSQNGNESKIMSHSSGLKNTKKAKLVLLFVYRPILILAGVLILEPTSNQSPVLKMKMLLCTYFA